MAGYKAHHDSPYQLRDNPGVKRRIKELERAIAVKTRVSVESMTAQFVEDRDFARQLNQPAAAHAASVAVAKLHGLMIDRKEQGAPGDFANLSVDEVLALVRAELGDEAVALLIAKEVNQVAPIETIEEFPSLSTARTEGNA